MTESSTAYLFLELAVFCFILGFCWEEFWSMELRNRRVWMAILALAGFWFAIDQFAVGLGLWTFPEGASLPVRLFALPLEEYLLFFMHTFLCLVLLRHFSATRR
jgi:lycopene cyclase domain-containing protein